MGSWAVKRSPNLDNWRRESEADLVVLYIVAWPVANSVSMSCLARARAEGSFLWGPSREGRPSLSKECLGVLLCQAMEHTGGSLLRVVVLGERVRGAKTTWRGQGQAWREEGA